MTIDIENETQNEFDFEYKKVITDVINEAMDYVKCPYEAIVEVTITDNEGIRQINREQRGIDSPTDVLSFPMFDSTEEMEEMQRLTGGDVPLGDVVICMDKIREQAEEFGHSEERETVYLFTHSVLHLLGYDHEEDEDRKKMRAREEEIMESLGISRQEQE